jgi:hypothetical protein
MKFPYNVAARGQARRYTKDNLLTFDRATIDGTGAFLNGELERLDQTLHMPLVSYTWMRDIDLREDVSNADEVSSFTNSSFAAAPGISGQGGLSSGKSWAGKNTNAITGIQLDIGKTANPLTIWAMELSWSLPELASAEKLGRPIDAQKYEGLKLKWNMDTDAQVYVGDAELSFKGLFNNDANVTHNAVAVGAGGSTLWSAKTPQEILNDVNTLLTNTWSSSGWAVIPDQLRLPPDQYSYLVANIVSNAGNISILEFLKLNNLVKSSTGRELNIQPVKWLIGGGSGGTLGTANGHNRMVAYNKEVQYVRFPMTLLQRTPIENRGLYQITTYWNRLGVIEFVYPATVQYADGIG